MILWRGCLLGLILCSLGDGFQANLPHSCSSRTRSSLPLGAFNNAGGDGQHTEQQERRCPKISPLQHFVNAVTVVTLSLTMAASLPALPALAASSAHEKYWTLMQSPGIPKKDRVQANEALLDFAVGTINTMYYDSSGGIRFAPRDFYEQWRLLRDTARRGTATVPVTAATADHHANNNNHIPVLAMDTRQGAVQGLKYLVQSVGDPYSNYLTREELLQELSPIDRSFLGLGAIVEVPSTAVRREETYLTVPQTPKHLLTPTRAANLPAINAIAARTPAERAGLTVGDRIVAVGSDKFTSLSRQDVSSKLSSHYVGAENYVGNVDLTIARPQFAKLAPTGTSSSINVLLGYKTSHVVLPTTLVDPMQPSKDTSMVQYELLTPSSSLLDSSTYSKVGYIRLTRFSKLSTAKYIQAINDLEQQGAESYIIDLRNNYGGVIQEALLIASSLMRDPHTVLCYTLNSRGGFRPHDAEEYIVDTRYPGYLLSSEPTTVALDQVKRENPAMFASDDASWTAPSSYASLQEQSVRRHMHIGSSWQLKDSSRAAQKKLVILMNEGTASSAEVFLSSLHDNGRTVALVGTKTYGKGLIQHTFPMPDGGGLRLTVAEYLTPTLRHVTKVGSAQFDTQTGALVGGGIQPDLYCDSKQGIPSKAGADFCVSVALDALEEAKQRDEEQRDEASLMAVQQQQRRPSTTIAASPTLRKDNF